MGMHVKYVGPKDAKRYNGQLFPRLVSVEVPSGLASVLLADPNSFLPANAEVPDEVLAQRDRLPLALEAEGHDRVEQYTMRKAEAMLLAHGSIDEKSGKPDAVMQKRLDWIQGAQDEIDYGNSLIKKAAEMRAKIATEKAIAAAGPDDPEDPADDAPNTPSVRRGRAKAEAVVA